MGGTPPVRYLLCVVPCKLYFAEDKISDQISIKEYFDPFTGEQVNKSK